MTIRHRTICAVVLLNMLCGEFALAKDEIAIIVANDATEMSLTSAKLRNIYLKKIVQDESGQALIPVNLPPENPLRRSLAETLFNRSSQQIQDYWNQQYFQGITPPYVLNSQEAVLQFVAKTPGAIGYIAACRVDARVKQVMSLAAGSSLHEDIERLCTAAGNTSRQN